MFFWSYVHVHTKSWVKTRPQRPRPKKKKFPPQREITQYGSTVSTDGTTTERWKEINQNKTIQYKKKKHWVIRRRSPFKRRVVCLCILRVTN